LDFVDGDMEVRLIRLNGGDISRQGGDVGGERGDELLELVEGGGIPHGGGLRAWCGGAAGK
jgi:hypothetical protein